MKSVWEKTGLNNRSIALWELTIGIIIIYSALMMVYKICVISLFIGAVLWALNPSDKEFTTWLTYHQQDVIPNIKDMTTKPRDESIFKWAIRKLVDDEKDNPILRYTRTDCYVFNIVTIPTLNQYYAVGIATSYIWINKDNIVLFYLKSWMNQHRYDTKITKYLKSQKRISELEMTWDRNELQSLEAVDTHVKQAKQYRMSNQFDLAASEFKAAEDACTSRVRATRLRQDRVACLVELQEFDRASSLMEELARNLASNGEFVSAGKKLFEFATVLRGKSSGSAGINEKMVISVLQSASDLLSSSNTTSTNPGEYQYTKLKCLASTAEVYAESRQWKDASKEFHNVALSHLNDPSGSSAFVTNQNVSKYFYYAILTSLATGNMPQTLKLLSTVKNLDCNFTDSCYYEALEALLDAYDLRNKELVEKTVKKTRIRCFNQKWHLAAISDFKSHFGLE